MPKSFLVKKKRGACGAWQWKESEQAEWKEDNTAGKTFMCFYFYFELSKVSMLV